MPALGLRKTATAGRIAALVAAPAARGSTTTAAPPAGSIPRSLAARGDRSMIKRWLYGPRSLILTITERPLSRLVTLAQDPSGSERCAAVGVTVSSGSPLEVRAPTRAYQAA